jgi:hypothetical protein
MTIAAFANPEHAEQLAADKSTNHPDTEIAENAKSLALPSDHQRGEASPQETDNDPNDGLSERRHHTLLLLNSG